MPWQHTLKADLRCHGPFTVTSNEREIHISRGSGGFIFRDVETYGAGEKEIWRTLMWLFKVHWTTCDNSHSSCIIHSVSGPHLVIIVWTSAANVIAFVYVGILINPLCFPIYEWVSYFSYVFLISTIPFSSFGLTASKPVFVCLLLFVSLSLYFSDF